MARTAPADQTEAKTEPTRRTPPDDDLMIPPAPQRGTIAAVRRRP